MLKMRETYSPEARYRATKQEDAIALHKRWQEGEEAIHGHTNEQTLPSANLVGHTTPEEGPYHHPHIHNAACSE